jgi:hypothetical protein
MFESLVEPLGTDARPLTAEERKGSECVEGPDWRRVFMPAPDEYVEVVGCLPLDEWTLARLAEVDASELSLSGQMRTLEIVTRYASYVESLRSNLVATVAGPAPQTEAQRNDDVGAALVSFTSTASVQASGHRVAIDRDLAERLQASRVALAAGRITYQQVAALSAATRALDLDLARKIETRVLRYAHRQDLTKFRKSLARACAALDPDWTDKAEQVRRDAIVEHTVFDDGTGTLFIRGPLEITTAVDRALSAQAARTRNEFGGTAPQRKLAALRDMTERFLAAPGAPKQHGRLPEVHVTVDLPTVLGMTDNPAQIVGVGPVPADVARNLLADGAPMRRLIIDPTSGHLLDYGTSIYKVPPRVAEMLIARYPTATTPNSNVDSRLCDMEHNVPAQRGGPTNPANNTPTDRRWHRAKTFLGYSYTIDPVTAIDLAEPQRVHHDR